MKIKPKLMTSQWAMKL